MAPMIPSDSMKRTAQRLTMPAIGGMGAGIWQAIP